MDHGEGAPQSIPQEAAQGPTVSAAVEQPKPDKGPGPLRKFWMTIRGQNHLPAADLHNELAAQKSAASDQTIAEMTQRQDLSAPVGGASAGAVVETTLPPATTPSAETPTATKSEELAPIGGTSPTSPAEGSQPAQGVDEMISELEENVKVDAKSEEDPTPAEDSATIALEATKKEDTGEALDAVAANMAKIPDAPSATPAIAEPESAVTSESDTTPANVIDITAKTGVTSVATNPTDSPIDTGGMTVLPTVGASENSQGTGAMAAGSGDRFQSNTPEPVQEAAIGMRNAVDASTASDKADSDLATSAQKVIDIEEARAQRDAAMQPLGDTAGQSGEIAPTTQSPAAQSPSQLPKAA